MTAYFALDIGTRRTGVAFADTSIGIAHPRPTLLHTSLTSLVDQVVELCRVHRVTELVLGLPLLPSGIEGSQAAIVRSVLSLLEARGLVCTLLDERYTSPRDNEGDGDARAAAALLETFLARKSKGSSV